MAELVMWELFPGRRLWVFWTRGVCMKSACLVTHAVAIPQDPHAVDVAPAAPRVTASPEFSQQAHVKLMAEPRFYVPTGLA